MLSRGKLMVKNALENTERKVLVENVEVGTWNLNLVETSNLVSSIATTSLLSFETSRSTEKATLNSESDEDSNEPFQAGSSDEYVPSEVSSENESSENETIEQIEDEVTGIDLEKAEEEEVAVNQIKPKRKLKIFLDKPKICRKRIKRPETWKRVEAAKNRAQGKAYQSQKGHTVAEKKVCLGSLCSEKCRLQCDKKFNIDMRNSILKEFYGLDINSKNSLLFKSIVGRPTNRKVKSAKKHKSFTYDYLITRNNNQIKVCKPAFCALLQISKKKVEIIQKKLQKGSSAPSPDRRGHHSNRPHKISDEVIEYIKAHIGNFPSESSHYSRNSNPYKKYLSPQLNMSIMYRLYLEKCEEEKKPDNFKIKKTSYVLIFSTKFNLSFSHPKSDTCSKCDAGESNEEHLENVKCGFALLKSDRETASHNDDILYITVDLQQTMPLPKLTTSKAFYLRQLWFYNLGIHAVSTNGEMPTMQTWTENIANRGSIEVISGLWNFIQNFGQAKTRQHLRIWSDSCAGQNKNFQMVCFFQFLILKKMFKSIEHKFPEVGHTYLDSDRDFGRIEKVLRKTETVYTPDQYRNLIKQASKKGSTVNNMEHQFYDFERLSTDMGLINRKKNTLNEKVSFRDGVKWIKIETFGSYLYKETYDPYTPFKEVNLLKNMSRGELPEVELVRLPHKYGSISQEKLENLQLQLKFVPDQHCWFYNDIFEEASVREPQQARKKAAKKRATL